MAAFSRGAPVASGKLYAATESGAQTRLLTSERVRRWLWIALLPLLLSTPLALGATAWYDTVQADAMNAVGGEEESQCGLWPDRQGAGRVVGGVASRPAPWMVQLVRGGRHICAGALISARHVLTAAHCVTDRHNAPWAGDLRLWLPAIGTERAAERVLVHEAFNAEELRHDLALLVLDQPVYGGDQLAVCLPEPGSAYQGAAALVAGWGAHSFGGGAARAAAAAGEEHREAVVSVLGQDECSSAHLGLLDISDEQLCAGSPEGADACSGDSGGPLVVGGDSQRFSVIGVTSFGVFCGDTRFPGVYTRVAAYLGWINGAMAANP